MTDEASDVEGGPTAVEGEGDGLLGNGEEKNPLDCERLKKARKSFSRCPGIDESNETLNGGSCEGSGEVDNERPAVDPLDDEDTMSGGCRSSNVGAALDVLTASLSVIHLEKFALSKRRVSRMLPRCLHRTFVDSAVEQLFQVYHGRQRRQDLNCLLAAGIFLAVYTCIVSACLLHVPALVAGALLGGLQILFSGLASRITLPERLWAALPYLVWLTVSGQILLVLILGPTAPNPGPHIMTPANPAGLIWVIVVGFLALVALPLRVPPCVALAFTTAVLYTAIAACVAPAPHLGELDPAQATSVKSVFCLENTSKMNIDNENISMHGTEIYLTLTNPEISSEIETQQNPEISSEIETQQNPEISSEIETQQNLEISSEIETQQNLEISSEIETQQNPEISSEIETQQNPEISSEIETQQNPEISSEIESQQNPDISSEIEAQQNPEISSEIETQQKR
ncbi:hypothetical protein FHG87_014752 [Trinorchestia longiramus]|nr:hypothetical protein FHG87_014752 [Trinorchestia longiramus]